MARSKLRLIKNVLEYQSIDDIFRVPVQTRGVYALYQYNKRRDTYDVVYIGMARGDKTGIRGRLNKHSKRKRGLWTHYSAYEVWDNVSEVEVEELEGLFRHMFKYDSKANRLNKQKGYKKLAHLSRKTSKLWVKK